MELISEAWTWWVNLSISDASSVLIGLLVGVTALLMFEKPKR